LGAMGIFPIREMEAPLFCRRLLSRSFPKNRELMFLKAVGEPVSPWSRSGNGGSRLQASHSSLRVSRPGHFWRSCGRVTAPPPCSPSLPGQRRSQGLPQPQSRKWHRPSASRSEETPAAYPAWNLIFGETPGYFPLAFTAILVYVSPPEERRILSWKNNKRR
jgi:hypothetical protein